MRTPTKKRPVNKTDGGKAKAKKQLSKARRVDARNEAKSMLLTSVMGGLPKKSIVEKVFEERNFTTGSQEPPSTAPVVMETGFGKVRIEGEVTPQKMQLAKDFDRMFQQATAEIEDLATMTPNPATLDYVKDANLTPEKMGEIKAASPWSVFQIKGIGMMKTPDNKLETVQSYCYRLEKAVINVAKQKNVEIDGLMNRIKEQDIEISNLRRDNKRFSDRLSALQRAARKLEEQMEALPAYTFQTATGKVLLRVQSLFGNLKTFLIKLVSK